MGGQESCINRGPKSTLEKPDFSWWTYRYHCSRQQPPSSHITSVLWQSTLPTSVPLDYLVILNSSHSTSVAVLTISLTLMLKSRFGQQRNKQLSMLGRKLAYGPLHQGLYLRRRQKLKHPSVAILIVWHLILFPRLTGRIPILRSQQLLQSIHFLNILTND